MKRDKWTKNVMVLKMRINICFVLAIALTMFTDVHVSAEDKIILLEPEASCITSSCHDNMGKKKYAHAIGVDGEKCTICHEQPGKDEHVFGKIPQVTELFCNKCHSEDTPPPPNLRKNPPKVILKNKELQLHAPFARGECTECHDPHESDNYRHLKLPYPVGIYARFSAGTYSLCFTKCHIGLEDAFIEPRTLDLTQFRNGNLNLHFRHVNKKKGRACIICHHNHGTKNPKLIKDNFQFGNSLLTIGYEKTATGGKCATTCHRTAEYDRYEPIYNLIKVSPRPGTDATKEELKKSRERDMKRQDEKAKQKDTQKNKIQEE